MTDDLATRICATARDDVSDRRKSDRSYMSKTMTALCAALGLTCEDRSVQARMIGHTIRFNGGLAVRVEFNGEKTRPDVHVMCFHVDGSEARLNPSKMIGCNPYHFRKWTVVRIGFIELLDTIFEVAELTNSGEAYQDSRFGNYRIVHPYGWEHPRAAYAFVMRGDRCLNVFKSMRHAETGLAEMIDHYEAIAAAGDLECYQTLAEAMAHHSGESIAAAA